MFGCLLVSLLESTQKGVLVEATHSFGGLPQPSEDRLRPGTFSHQLHIQLRAGRGSDSVRTSRVRKRRIWPRTGRPGAKKLHALPSTTMAWCTGPFWKAMFLLEGASMHFLLCCWGCCRGWVQNNMRRLGRECVMSWQHSVHGSSKLPACC